MNTKKPKLSALGKILFILIGLIFFVNSIPLFAQDYQTLVMKGDEYYKQFDNLKALEEYKSAYQLAPDEFDPLMKLTRAYIDAGEDLDSDESESYYIKAGELAEQLQKNFSDSARSYHYLSLAYGKLALFRGGKEKVRFSRFVEENAKKANQLDPAFTSPHIVLGVYYREVANLNWFLKKFAQTLFGGLPDGTNEDSERMLLKAIELDPESITAHYELAFTYKMMDEEEKAVAYFEKALTFPIGDHRDHTKIAEAKKQLRELKT